MPATPRILVLLGLVGVAPLSGQQPGRIIGQVFDGASGRPLPGAQIFIQGTQLGTLAGIDGRYTLSGVPAGQTNVTAVMLGYGQKTVTGVAVPAGGAVKLDVVLTVAAIALEGITVSAAAELGTVGSALNEQRLASGVLSSITTDEIARSPDSDAAAAIKRVSGVTVQDGKYVFVRGLGERYTTTALNGARLPSPEPERKVVPLDLFPSSLLQNITTSKTFTPDLRGDFSGAQVDIRLRDFPMQRQINVSTSLSANSAATGQDFLVAPFRGESWLAIAAAERQIPVEVERWGNFEQMPQASDVNRMIGSFRNVWSTRAARGTPGGSLSASIGGRDPIFGHELGYLLSGTYSYSEEAKADHRRAQALASDGDAVTEVDRYEGTTGVRSVLWGGVLSLGTQVGEQSRLTLDASYNRTADDEARFESGFSENLGQEFQIDRLRYVERWVGSLQLGGEHQLGANNRTDWRVTRSEVARSEPDRSEIVYQVRTDPVTGARLAPAWFSSSNEGAVRTFGYLDGTGMEGTLNHRISWGSGDRANELRFGGMASRTDRTADNRVYSIAGVLDPTSRELQPEEIFDGRFAGASPFRITPLSQGGSYDAEDRLYAGYGMLQLQLGSALEAVGGARVERSEVVLDAVSTVGDSVRTSPTYTDVLPSLSLNLRLSERQSLRFAATQTLSRPEYRELANVQYREVLGGDNVIGNPDLRRSLIRNADLRWEFYPTPVEALTVGVFMKRFQDPIERVYLATSGTRIVTLANAESAQNYGVELEARKGLEALTPALSPFTLFTNVTLMKSEIRIGSGVASRINDERPMVGQSPYVVNAGLTYATEDARTSATVLYNVVGRRVSSAAEAPLPDVYEEARQALDLSLRFSLGETTSAKLDLKNLLDSPYELRQGSVVREYYRTGRAASFGLSWRP